MARHRFSWSNIDPDLRACLCPTAAAAGDAAGADTSGAVVDTVADLTARFGARPTERFVAECWPVLCDEWLAADADARTGVVASLQAAHLGDTSLPVGGPDLDLAYLRSCRNQAGLRRVVLAAFLASGERPHPLAKAAPAGPTWEAFEPALAAAVAELDEGQCLVLSVRGTGVEGLPGPPGSSYYVQFVGGEGGDVRAEAVSNSFLVGDERLSPEAQVRLVELGWQPPTHLPGDEQADPEGSSNYFHDHAAPVDADAVASSAVAALREVYGVAEPAVLSYLAFDAAGTEFELPGLGVEHQQLASNVVSVDAEELLPTPSTPEELRAQVEGALLPVLTGGEVLYDDDGDIPIRFGSAQVFVRAGEEAPVVRVFAIVLTDLSMSSSLSEAINELNQRYLYGKFFWDGHSVVMAIDVPCAPFVGSHLLHAIGTVGEVADELDEELQEQFGGRTFYGVRAPEPDEGLSGGYL